MGKKVVITGGTGFVGSNLVRELLNKGHEVYLFVRKDSDLWRLEEIVNHLRIKVIDLNDFDETLKTIQTIRPDWCFHLATYGAYSSQIQIDPTIQTNIRTTINLANSCIKTGIEVFINTGSSSEYGIKDHAPKEFEYIEPNSLYAITKAAATHYCTWISKTQDISIATLRLYSVFGPYEEPNRLIPQVIIKGLKGTLPSLVNPDISRDFVFISDVIDSYFLVANNPRIVKGKIYNVGTGIQTTIREVVKDIKLLLPISSEPQWGTMDNRNWDTDIWVADHSKITDELSWIPKFTFLNGLSLTIEWLRKNNEILEYYWRK